jgi:hypothetical protein
MEIYNVSVSEIFPFRKYFQLEIFPLPITSLKVHSLNCVFFIMKSSVFIVIYGVDDCRK